MTDLTREQLERARDLGAATYFSAYVQLMASHLGVNNVTQEAMNDMALLMAAPMNHAMTATWCAMMGDIPGRNRALLEFKEELDNLRPI